MFSASGSADGPDEFGRLSLASQDESLVEVGPFGEANGGTLAQQPNQTNIKAPGVFSTADLSHVIYETTHSLWSFNESERESVYEYAGAGATTPLMVGVEGPSGSRKSISTCYTHIAGVSTLYQGEAMSEDGQMVYFSPVGRDEAPCAGSTRAPAVTGLYVRVDAEKPGFAHTVLVSSSKAEVCTEGKGNAPKSAPQRNVKKTQPKWRTCVMYGSKV